MKFLVAGLLFAFSSFAYTIHPKIKAQDILRLSCQYSYESTSQSEPISDSFGIFAKKNENGTYSFAHSEIEIPSYYFTFNGIVPKAVWHRDSEFYFSATLDGEVLEYSFELKNYTHDTDENALLGSTPNAKPELTTVAFEDRSVYVFGLSDHGFMEFNFDQGKLMDRYSNSSPWINEFSISIESCAIEQLGV